MAEGLVERPDRSLVVPMFNEAQRIGITLAALVDSDLAKDRFEILLVDDGSADGTADIAERRAAELGLTNVRVIRAAMNRGKGAAVRAGMLAAVGDLRVFADADLSAGVDDILACFERLAAGDVEVVFASRAHPDSQIDDSQPGHRVMTGRTFNAILRRLDLTDELDTQCGLKGFTAEAARTIFSAVTIEGFAFDVEVLALAHRDGMRVEPMPTRWSHVGASRVRPIRDGASMLRDVLALRRAIRRVGPAQPSTLSASPVTLAKYEMLTDLEERHWWFAAKRALVAEVLDREAGPFGTGVDVGCSIGGARDVLAVRTNRAVGLDTHGVASARVVESHAGDTLVVVGDAARLPVASSSADVVTVLDELQSLPDDLQALCEYRRVLGDAGLLVLTAPAHRWVWGHHDERHAHVRRYTRAELRAVVEAAGFEVDRITHFHSWLAPVAAVVRRSPIRHVLRGEEEEISYFRPAVNRILGLIARIERHRLRRGDLPFGLSLLVVARASGPDR